MILAALLLYYLCEEGYTQVNSDGAAPISK